MGQPRRVKRMHLLGRLRQKTQRAAVAEAGRLAIDRGGNGEGAGRAAVEIAVLVRDTGADPTSVASKSS
jgi:hypothetical protein